MAQNFLPQPSMMFDDAFGGSCTDIWYRGVNIIDKVDTGRLLQTAWQFDDKGEGDNPTQGGSAYDYRSVIYSSYYASPTVKIVECQPAYWFPVNGQVLSDCTIGVTSSISGITMSDHVVCLSGSDHFNGGIEVRTAYVPTTVFSNIGSMDPMTGIFIPLAGTRELWTGNAGHDAIVAQGPGDIAIALWSPNSGGQYGVTDYAAQYKVLKIDVWAGWDHPSPSNPYVGDSFTIVGTMSEVAAALRQLASIGLRTPEGLMARRLERQRKHRDVHRVFRGKDEK